VSELLVITFDERETAGQACERLKGLQTTETIDLRDVAVVEKDAEGDAHVRAGFERISKGGAVAGGALGLIIGGLFLPVAGLAIGAAIGGIVGRSLRDNVDKKLVEDVTADLTEDTSALFVLGTGSASAIVGALDPYKGKVYHTTVDSETEAQIQAALDHEGGA
jgi:uncharacterized membrane protein